MPWRVNPVTGEPPTGEPDAGDPPVRFGGRGGYAVPTPIHGISHVTWLKYFSHSGNIYYEMQTNREARTSRIHEKKSVRVEWHPVPDWRSRGYLPHCDEIGFIQNITFRLSDSVPAKIIADWRDELKINPGLTAYDPRNVEFRRRLDKYEDACHGDCLLKDPEIAGIVQNALLFFDDERYRLLEWCVMPNHVHALILPIHGHLLADIVHSWKSYTGHTVKKLLNLTKPFWMREYHDRFIRGERHLEIARNYIRQNPVAAGFVLNEEDWQWSSASRGTWDVEAMGAPASSPVV